MITIPTISQIRDQIITDIEGKIGQTVPALPKAFFRVLATALAGVLALLYRFAAWVYRQIFPQTADADALSRIGEQYGIVRRPAVAAVLSATATGVNATVIPAETLWQYGGVVYRQTADATITTGTATISIAALTTGAATTLSPGVKVSMVTPLAGVDADATIVSTVTEGVDREDVETYRARIIQRLQQRPQGGATPDYIGWTLEVPGVVKAFAFRTDAGEVTVYPLVALSGSRLPDAGKLAEVLSYVNDTARRPLCANVLAAAMTERTFTPTVTALSPNTSAMKDAVQAAWSAYLLRAFPLQYPDEVNPTNVVSLAAFYSEAIGAGVKSITVSITIDGGGTVASHTLADDELAKLGTIVWP